MRRPPPPVRRQHPFARLLIAAAGLCLGLFVQAQTVARSMRTTVDAKADEPGLVEAARQRGWPLITHPASRRPQRVSGS